MSEILHTLLTLLTMTAHGDISAMILLAPLPMTLLMTVAVLLHVVHPYSYVTGKHTWSWSNDAAEVLLWGIPCLAVLWGCTYALLANVTAFGV